MIIEDESLRSRLYRDISANFDGDPMEDEPGFWEAVKANSALNNYIHGEFIKYPNMPDNVIDNSNFNPFDYFTDEEKANEEFIDAAYLADNVAEIDAVRKTLKREREFRDIASRGSGWAAFASEAFDPINYVVPGGTLYKTYKGGYSLLKGGAVTAATLGTATAVEEAGLRHQQIERSFGESAVNVSAATFLGGLFGVGAAGFRNYVEKRGLDYNKLIEQTEYAFNFQKNATDGFNPVLDKSMGAAMVQNDRIQAIDTAGPVKIKGKAARAFAKGMNRFGGPLIRGITSDSDAMRKNMTKLAENFLAMETDQGRVLATQSVEGAIKNKEVIFVQAYEGHLSAQKQYLKELSLGKVGGFMRSGSAAKQFNEEVSKALDNGGQHPNKYVRESAKYWREKLYNPIVEQAKDVGLFEGLTDDQLLSYLNRKWDVQKLSTKEGSQKFLNVVRTWLVTKHSDKLGSSANIIARLVNDPTRADEMQELIKREFPDAMWTNEIINADSISQEILAKITSTGDGRLPYDYQIGENQLGRTTISGTGGSSDSAGLKGVFKERSFMIPNDLVYDLIELDVEDLATRYFRDTVPDIEMIRAYGDVDATTALKEIEDDWSEILKKAGKDPSVSERQYKNLKNQRDRDSEDFTGAVQRLRGVYNVASDDSFARYTQRLSSMARDANNMRFMGGVVPSSLPDLAQTVMAEGFVNVFSKGLIPLIRNSRQFKISKKEAGQYLNGMQAIQSRADVLADVAYAVRGSSKIETFIHSSSKKFSKINLLNWWTDTMKGVHAVTAQTRIADDLLKIGAKIDSGKVSREEALSLVDWRLESMGISRSDALDMIGEIKNKSTFADNVRVMNVGEWKDPRLASLWMKAMRKESDRVIIVPGQEKPLFMSRSTGATFLQFWSFMTSSTFKITASALQGQDKNMIDGLLALGALGSLTYAFKTWNAGRELSDDPRVWAMEAIDRTGALGIITQIDGVITKASRGTIGFRPIIGVEAPVGRRVHQSLAESLLGPTYGLALDGLFVAGRITESALGDEDFDVTGSDVRATRRLAWGQNLFYLRKGIDAMQEEIVESIE